MDFSTRKKTGDKGEDPIPAAMLAMGEKKLSAQEEKALRSDILREILPACQPQEGSPANTFTHSELEELQAKLPSSMQLGKQREENKKPDLSELRWPQQQDGEEYDAESEPIEEDDACPQDGGAPQDGMEEPLQHFEETVVERDWHGAPRFCPKYVSLPRQFRDMVRQGRFVAPTNAQCPGFLQCNLVVLPQGQHAFDFLLFCQRNPQACPLIEVCDVGSPHPDGVAKGADLRTDVPMYAIYRNGKLEKEVTDATDYWPQDSVAFLIGCSFSYDGALMDADIPLRSAEQGKNVPMYRTNLKCRPAGSLKGNMVVSMKPIPSLKISKHVEITSRYRHAHGGPVNIGCPHVIGVEHLDEPDWGDPIDVRPDEVPIFHACGVTPQSVLMDSKVPFAITHKAGYMFITDLPSDMGI